MVAEVEAYFHEGLRRVDSLCFVYVQEIADSQNGEVNKALYLIDRMVDVENEEDFLFFDKDE